MSVWTRTRATRIGQEASRFSRVMRDRRPRAVSDIARKDVGIRESAAIRVTPSLGSRGNRRVRDIVKHPLVFRRESIERPGDLRGQRHSKQLAENKE